ncbi:HlyD family efflux transporter periplasmic adaptor subunit [Aurantiacibacter zhengii]|uniref:HlyD family efflux transporter periplasmic adaptor subunit n=1 Tax=Aurantiacibacter zhengii TaxID=2307003 RepID=A0A418NUG6_9SPHN|nr:HlyD family efflux transporter periplasmic adaptor subunit [Aurantiacibacter zhengii]RIV87726.1 HlyD family efflux transporter periplasmic adaptor subunit [Aurantiacibacter zhengii]
MTEVKAQTVGGNRAEGTASSSGNDAALWAALASATGPAEFCRAWLALQCARTPGVRGGLILLESSAGAYAPAAAWPAKPTDIEPLRLAGEAVLNNREPMIGPVADAPGLTVIAYPVVSGEGTHGAIVMTLQEAHAAVLQTALRELHWGVGWILSLVWQYRAAEREHGGERAALAMELLAAVQEEESLDEAVLALCNETCRILKADRAAVGLVAGDKVKLAAMSHGAWFRKKSDFAETLEAAMEEAFDQGATIACPAAEEDAADITIQHARLATALGSRALASVMLEDRGMPTGVLLLERDKEGEAFSQEELLLCETAAALVAPTIALKRREERLLSGRIRKKGMDGAKAMFGPRRPLAKALGGLAIILLLFLLLPFAQFRVSADSALEGRVQRTAAVPFSGFIASSDARAGDEVVAGQVLARLDDRDLRLDHARAQSEVQQFDRRYRQALASHERSEMNLFGAQLRQAQAELRLIEYKLERVNIVAPIDGVLVSGDVSQLIGSPVEEGETLFEVAPMDDFRVVLQVAESDISYLQPGQEGRFAPTGLAGRTVPFTVTKLTSVTSQEDGSNTFRVEGELADGAKEILRPGLEGVAKVDVDRRSRLWIWTRGLRDWLRLFFWKWLP